MIAPANLFAPPKSLVADPEEAPPAARKPMAVWLMQGLAAAAALSTGGFLLDAFLPGLGAPRGVHYLLASAIGSWLVFALCLAVVIVDCQRRRRRGRRLGLFLVGLLLLYTLAWMAGNTSLADAHRGGLSGLLRPGLPWAMFLATVAWAWRFGFASPARAWFAVGP